MVHAITQTHQIPKVSPKKKKEIEIKKQDFVSYRILQHLFMYISDQWHHTSS